MEGGEYKFALIGAVGVGKSAFTVQLILNHFVDEYEPTIEDSYRKQVTIDKVTCLLDILDTAGQDEYLAKVYIPHALGFLLVYSVSSRSSFEMLQKHHLPQIKLSATSANYVVLGNKCDLEECREVSIIEGYEFAASINALFFETSAKYAINIHEAVFDLVRLVWQNRGDEPVSREKKKKCV